MVISSLRMISISTTLIHCMPPVIERLRSFCQFSVKVIFPFSTQGRHPLRVTYYLVPCLSHNYFLFLVSLAIPFGLSFSVVGRAWPTVRSAMDSPSCPLCFARVTVRVLRSDLFSYLIVAGPLLIPLPCVEPRNVIPAFKIHLRTRARASLSRYMNSFTSAP